MAKRFFGTDLWTQDWFLDMPNEYKLFWSYILSECDHAGFFKVNLRTFSALVEVKINSSKALELFNSDKQRIRVVKDNLWFIEDFIFFQYGSQLNPNNRLHNSVLKLLGQFDLNLTSIRGVLDLNLTSTRPEQDLKVGLKDKDKDKDKDSLTIKEDSDSRKFTPPTVEQFKEYFVENGFSAELGERAWKGYSEAGWKDSSGKPVKIWKSKCQHVWFTDKNNEHRIQTTHQPTPDAEALERVARYEANRRRPQPLFGN